MSSELLDSVLLRTDFPDLELFASGKVRDVYSLGADHLLFVATDRISAFDYVLATGIPHKGQVLTQISIFWFDFLRDVCPTTSSPLMSTSIRRRCRKYADQLAAAPCWSARRTWFRWNAWCAAIFPAPAGRSTRPAAKSAVFQLPAGLQESDKLARAHLHPCNQSHQRTR